MARHSCDPSSGRVGVLVLCGHAAGSASGGKGGQRCPPRAAAHERRGSAAWQACAHRGLGAQAYSRDVLSFIFVVLTAVNVWKASRKYKAPDMLNRQQTDEWKGWMQARATAGH